MQHPRFRILTWKWPTQIRISGHHNIGRLQDADGGDGFLLTAGANILNNQSQEFDKMCFLGLGTGRMAKNHSP